MTNYDDLLARNQAHVMQTYGNAPLALVRGEGCTVWDSDGKQYLDLVAGIAVCSLGHAHPKLIAAVSEQMQQIGHVSNLYLTEPAVQLAERLGELAGVPTKTFFANSGAEAIEAALKLARKHGRSVSPDKVEIVAAEGSFHGRTFAALSVTGQPAKQAPFLPMPGVVTFVPNGDVDALAAAVGPQTAAVVLEPIQGEGGVRPAPPGYLAAARQAASENNALLILDEVQTGIGRTGAWFGWQREGVVPDVFTLAKGLAGGLPIGACVGVGTAGDVLTAGDHASTFGGNPVVCAAALAVLDTMSEDGLVDRAKQLGEELTAGITAAGGAHVRGVRGAGLLLGIDLASANAKEVETAARDAGFLVNAIGADVVRVAPPLILGDDDMARFLAAAPALLGSARAG